MKLNSAAQLSRSNNYIEVNKHYNQNLSAHDVSVQIYSKMSFAQKWEESFKLRQTAWALKAAGLRALRPDWDEKQVQDEVKRIFLYAST